MKLLRYCLLVMLWPGLNSYAQSPPTSIRPLTIGNTVPDIEFDNVINYPVSKIRISDLKGKLVILDFWSSSCSSCLALFPHLQDLQNRFEGKLQVLLVNGKSRLYQDTESKIRNILERLKIRTGRDFHLPVIFDSPALDEWFPWRVIPHEVWIQESKVIAITGAEEITSKNILRILEGKLASLPLKADVMIDLNKQTLFALDRKPLYASILFKGSIDGLNGMGLIHDTTNVNLYTGWYSLNQPLIQIYKAAYREQMAYPTNQVIFDFQNSTLIKWTRDNTVFSYQVSVPPLSISMLLRYLQQDLSSKFHIRFKTEKRFLNCYILKLNPGTDIQISKGGNPEWVTENLDRHKYIRNYPLITILEDFNTYCKRPLLNESGITVNLDLEIPDGALSEQTMMASLRNAGFAISEEPREISVLIMTDQHF